ncbi:MAG: GNAT family N-acetyltransferase [Thermoanaerobaculia bacterium]
MRVILRETEVTDLPIFLEQQLDPEAARMASLLPRDRDAFMAHWGNIFGDEGVVTRTALLEAEVAGYVVCYEKEGQHLLGYWIGREFWGRGVATQAVAGFLGFVKVRPLRAFVAEQNRASIRVLEKSGFALRDRSVGDDGIAELMFELGESS